jgi:hypothetical protein
MPQFSFPKFDGSNPKLWIKNCETFFDIYVVPEHRWVKLGTMNFTGSAQLWLQTLPAYAHDMTWKDLGVAISNRFDKDERDHLYCRFFHLKQVTTVTEYIEHFSDIVHHLLIHNPNMEASIITNRFIDGLRDDIKAVVIVHRPPDLDTASSIALLQEEVTTCPSKKDFRRAESSNYNKKNMVENGRNSMPSTPIHTRAAVQANEDRRINDPIKPKLPDALSELKSYWRAKGLCFKCGEKWGPSHKCPKSVSLYAVEELWRFYDAAQESPDHTDSDSGDDLMTISIQAVKGIESNKTVRLMVYLANQNAYMLVDSGSTTSFIS